MWVVYAWNGTLATGLTVAVRRFPDEESAARFQRNAKKPNKVRVIEGSIEQRELIKSLWNHEV